MNLKSQISNLKSTTWLCGLLSAFCLLPSAFLHAQSVNFYPTNQTTVLVTNVVHLTNITQVITNDTSPLIPLTQPVIDPLVGRRLFAVVGGPVAFGVTNFTNDRVCTLYLANPKLFPITWPAARWKNGVMPSPTNDFPIVLFESIGGMLIATE